MLFHLSKVLLKGFTVLSKILSAYFVAFSMQSYRTKLNCLMCQFCLSMKRNREEMFRDQQLSCNLRDLCYRSTLFHIVSNQLQMPHEEDDSDFLIFSTDISSKNGKKEN